MNLFTHQWVLIGYFSLMTLIGIPGNALVVAAYGTKLRKTSTDVLILAVACTDLVLCLWNPAWIWFWTTAYRHDNLSMCRLVMCFTFVVVHVNVFITTTISLDRYLAVFRPLERSLRTPKRALMSVGVCVFLALAITTPVFQSIRKFPLSNFPNSTVCWVAPESSSEFALYMLALIAYCVSFIIVTVLYACIYARLRHRAKVGPGTVMQAGVSTIELTGTTAAGLAECTTLKLGPKETPPPKTRETGDIDNKPCSSELAQAPLVLDHISKDTQTLEKKVKHGITNPKMTPDFPQSSSSVVSSSTTEPNQHRVKMKNKITAMLAIVTVVTYVAWVPTLVAQFFLERIGFVHFFSANNATAPIFWVARNGFAINHVANPIIYGIMNKRFRQDCCRLLRRLRPRR